MPSEHPILFEGNVAIKGHSISSRVELDRGKFSRTVAATLGGGLVISLLLVSPVSASSDAVDFGRAGTFAVLAATGITHTTTGTTNLSGSSGADIGSSPTVSLTNSDRVTTTGTKYTANEDAVKNAQLDLQKAYDELAGRNPVATIGPQIGGLELTAGIYQAGYMNITGDLTLNAEDDPDAVFIFQMETTLVTAVDSTVTLINGAQACNVMWQVGTSSTLNTHSHIKGAIAAKVTITALTGASIDGQLLALTGAVTLDQNTIVNDACAEAADSVSSDSDSSDSVSSDSDSSDSVSSDSGSSDSGSSDSGSSDSDSSDSDSSDSDSTHSTSSDSDSGHSTSSDSDSGHSTSSDSTGSEPGPNPWWAAPSDSSSHETPAGATGTIDGGVLPNTGFHNWIFAVGAGIIGVAVSLWAFARSRRRNRGHV